MRKTLSLIALLSLAGCATAPDYKTPELPLPEKWSVPLEGGTSPESSAIAQWWKSLDDPKLHELIDGALLVNLDIKQARASLREARANRAFIAPDRYPQVQATASATRSRSSGNASFGGGGNSGATGAIAGLAGGGSFGGASMNNLFEAGFDASWELDLFGGVAKELEAADASVEAAAEALRNTQVILTSEVAREYLEVRGAQRRLTVAHANIASQADSVSIAKSRYDAGLSSELDVKQAQALLATTEAVVPSLESAVTAGILRLAILTRQRGARLLEELNAETTWPARPEIVPIGLPTDLLRRRPDIRRAERELAAATARIGVAVADLYPKFTLTGRLGGQSSEATTINLADARFWSFGPSVSLPIFNREKIKANIAVQNARTDAALAGYEKAVLVGLDEAQTALVAYAKEQTRLGSLNEAVAANQRALDIANELYRQGLADFLNVIQAHGNLFAAQDSAIVSELTVLQQMVALYKAVGGGWDPEEDLITPNPEVPFQ